MYTETSISRPTILQREPQFFLQQFGISGADSQLGWRTHPDAIVLYVDSGHGNANDSNWGTDPLHPKATVQSAVDSTLLTPYSEIRISGTVSESVVTPDSSDGPNYVWIRGQGVSRYSPTWTSDLETTIALDMRATGWKVSGFRFLGNTTAANIAIRYADTNANDVAIKTVIQECYFDGQIVGLTAIESHGAFDVWILNNTFSLWNNAGNTSCCLRAVDDGLAIPLRNYVIGNVFDNSDNGVIFPCNGSYFTDNVFQPVGVTYTMVQALQTSVGGTPGDDNVVTRNHFGGTYSVAGGYTAGAADDWVGNIAMDVASPQVADNGYTVLRPV